MNLDDLTKKFSSSTENQRKAIFSTLFIAGNKLQTLFDNLLFGKLNDAFSVTLNVAILC